VGLEGLFQQTQSLVEESPREKRYVRCGANSLKYVSQNAVEGCASIGLRLAPPERVPRSTLPNFGRAIAYE
jgi:hypothetical protein